MTIKICLVEDDTALREIFAEFLARADDMELVGQYGDAESAIVALPSDKPDVVLMDINLPGKSGIECVRELKPLMPEIQFMMVTVYQDADNIFQALTAGATGYLLKQASRTDLLQAVREVYEGGSPISSHIARKVVQAFQEKEPSPSDAHNLSSREQEVIELLAEGYLLKEIGDRLNVSVHTVGTYTRRIYEKLHVHSRSQAVAYYSAQQGQKKHPTLPRRAKKNRKPD